MKRVVVIALAILASGLSVGQVSAQQATPSASGCILPGDVSAPDFPEVAATPEAIASPQAVEALPAGDLIAGQIEETANALAGCLSSADTSGIIALTTAEFLGDMFGGGERMSPVDFSSIVDGAPVVETRILAVDNVQFTGIATVSADVRLVYSHQLLLEQWTFLYQDRGPTDGTAIDSTQGSWYAHRIAAMTPEVPAGAPTVEAALDEYEISLDRSSVAGPDVVIEAVNDGTEAHELLIVQLSGGASVEQLLRPSSGGFPAGIEVAGQLSLLPDEEGALVLVDLEPGTYVIVCLFPDASGVPHLAFGQETTLNVT